MLRIGAIFVGLCMVLIAASIGAVLYLALKLDARSSAIVALAALAGMILFNTITARLRDRALLGDQIADLSRGTADLARQVGEVSRRLSIVEARVSNNPVDSLAEEIGELGGLMRQVAETAARHEAALQGQGALPRPMTAPAEAALELA